jgi:hypothetical protein
VVGDPILPPVRGPGERLPRRAVAEMTEQLGVDLQKLFDQARKEAGRA